MHSRKIDVFLGHLYISGPRNTAYACHTLDTKLLAADQLTATLQGRHTLKTSMRFKFDATGSIQTNLAQSFSLLGDDEENLNLIPPRDSMELPVDEWFALLAGDFMRLSDSLRTIHKLHQESVTALEGKLTLLSTLIG
jgi:hypothetical protein